MVTRSVLRAAALAFAVLAAASGVSAHGLLKGAVPADRAKLSAAPKEVVITFSEALEPALSRIVVRDAAGRQVDKGDSAVAGGNRRILTVGLNDLTPGTYEVIWAITSVDTHRTEGRYAFEVLN